MTDRPILFSGPMVRALLDGRKTQTRRAVTPNNVDVLGHRWTNKSSPWAGLRFNEAWARGRSPSTGVYMPHLAVPFCHPDDEPTPTDECGIYRVSPITEIGDRLWVREHWRTAAHVDKFAPSVLPVDSPVFFEADAGGEAVGANGRFRQGMHMPRWASRLTLTVTDVRVERVQDINEDDARAEGVLGNAAGPWGCEGLLEDFEHLWDSINAERGFGWDVNPWVVALTFNVHRCNIDRMCS